MKKVILCLLFIFSNSYLIFTQPAIQWQKSLGGSEFERANSIQQTFAGGYILSGFSNSSDGDVTGHHGTIATSDFWIVKLNNTGTIQWQKSLGGTFNEGANAILQVIDGGFIIFESSTSNDGDVTGNHGNYDYWIVKIDGVGTIQWQRSLGGSSDDIGITGQKTTDGGFIIAGFSESNDGDVTGNHGSSDYWIVKLSPLVDINELHRPITNLQIIPNPFSIETQISFQLSTSIIIDIEIRDNEGRLIKTLNPKNLNHGLNEIFWDASDNSGSKVSDGIYFVTITSENFCES